MKIGTLVMILFTAAWMIPFVYFMGRAVVRANANRDHRRKLLETGVAGRAEILSVKEVGPHYSRVPHLEFRLRVEASAHRAAPFEAGAKGFFDRIQYPSLQPGMTVDVRYDASDLTTVAVVGDKLV